MIETVSGRLAMLRSAAMRGICFLVLWVMISGADPAGLAAGVIAAAAAAWASLRPLPLARLALRFPVQSLVAGSDVARRAFDPRLPLRPGFVRHPSLLPEGSARNAFASLMSLLPGSLPAGPDKTGGMLIHCLDTRQPVAAQLAAEEALFARIIAG